MLSVAGDCDRATVRALVEKYFGPIPANPDIPPLPDMSLPAIIGTEIRETVEDRVPLPRVYVGFRAPVFGDTRLDALDLAAQLLAGGKGSRLHRRLVRDERLAQDVAVFTLPFIGGASVCIGWATVRPGVDVATVEAAYLEELEKLASEVPSEDELDRAKALTEADELGSLARVEERADRLSMYATLCDDPGLINTLLPRYLSVTAEQIRDAARDVFRADNRVVLTYVPQARRRDHRGGGMTATGLIADRPVPGEPRPYDFPFTARFVLANGLRLIVTPMPGRELVSASLAVRSGAADEPAALGGATVLAARALTEGTEVRDAIALNEAAERLGASIHAEAGWDATSAGLDVPASRLAPALELLAEVVRRPSFPASEVERLRDERLTDLLQAKADPRRRADEAYVSTIYAPSSPYHRPAGGTAETVATLTAAELRRRPRSGVRARPVRGRGRG